MPEEISHCLSQPVSAASEACLWPLLNQKRTNTIASTRDPLVQRDSGATELLDSPSIALADSLKDTLRPETDKEDDTPQGRRYQMVDPISEGATSNNGRRTPLPVPRPRMVRSDCKEPDILGQEL